MPPRCSLAAGSELQAKKYLKYPGEEVKKGEEVQKVQTQ
jgi:hypothetical protein